MRNFNFKQYESLLEHSKHYELQQHMRLERLAVEAIHDLTQRDVIDLGAGYGRCLPFLTAARRVYSVEINPAMLEELRLRSQGVQNTSVVEGDFGNLSSLLANENLVRPVFVAMQNTFGTLEHEGSSVFDEVRKIAEQKDSFAIFSFFRQKSLPSWGRRFYASISEMAGDIDEAASKLDEGLFISKTGYTSRWRTDEEIDSIVNSLGGNVEYRVVTYHCVIVGFRLGAVDAISKTIPQVAA